jgi:hypothetical protein
MTRFFKILTKNYPRNFIIEKPLIGTLLFNAFCFTFLMLYKPLHTHGARFFSFGITMAIYMCILSVPVYFVIKLLKSFRYFSVPDEWTLLKELLAIFIVLAGMGIALYFAGFLMEGPVPDRWNMATFLNSCINAFMIGIIPFMFFTATNYRHLFVADIIKNFKPDAGQSAPGQSEKMIEISSQLKKEELSFYPGQLIFAESDGNYVVFHLKADNQIRKKTIRNSIGNIEQQLSEIPYLIRTHRAFIVNVKQVASQKGNTLGYRLKFNGIETVIPVSRQNTRDFDQLLKQYR